MSAKRIILMYISEVSGHHSATLAVEKAIRIIAPKTTILNINAFNYTNPISEKIINRLYMTVIKNTPQIWDYLYDNPGIVRRIEKIKDTIHKLNSSKLKSLFNEFKPDVVACAQAFPCGMVADYKKFYSSKLPLVAILTDYIPHAYWIYDTVNYYITPSDEVGARLVQRGVPQEKIRAFGIPADIKFNAKVDKNSILTQLGLTNKSPVLLVMGGGQGLGPIKTIVESLESAKADFQEVVITGNNKKLLESLSKKTKKYKKPIKILGYASNIHEIMDIARLIITKPGGITTAEALIKKLPLLIINPIPGQEANNSLYLTKQAAAVKIDDLENINMVIDDLLSHPEKLQSLSKQAAAIAKPNASMDIANMLVNL